MKGIITILVLIILLITSCSSEERINYEYTFIGEGNYWKGKFISKGTEVWGEESGRTTYDHKHNDEFILEFKDRAIKEVSSLNNLEYSFKTSAGSGSGSENIIFIEPSKGLEIIHQSGGTGVKINQDEGIQVTVKWDEYEESFVLNNKDK
ncbi:hypothetical protein VQL36_03370 [Chengkuizengella sp. SCS-71B]|uniref:hypothetical protein n=1 Tax=Chengkuizengella sp. SCS-71B TaxID=3115290 RepID=UPI0032C22A41